MTPGGLMFDVIVVGGGPGGSETAFALASRGCSVAVVDHRTRLGEKLCSGIVSRECAEDYAIPRSLIWRAARSAEVFPPLGESFTVERNEVQAYLIDRGAFVREVAERASARGAHFLLGERATLIERDSSGVTVRTLAASRESRSVRGRAVVIASGFGSRLSQSFGLPTPGASAYAAQVTVSGISDDHVRVFARRLVPEAAFGWVAPTRHRQALVGLLGRGRPVPALRAFLRALHSERGLQFSAIERIQAWGVPIRPATQTYADRCLLVGDAAGHVKPTTGGGIYYALRAGDMAGEVLARCLNAGDLSAAALAEYEDRWKADFGKELRLGYLTRLVYERMGDRELSAVLHAVAKSGLLSEEVSFDRHGELVIRALKSRLFGGMLDRLGRIGSRVSGGA